MPPATIMGAAARNPLHLNFLYPPRCIASKGRAFSATIQQNARQAPAPSQKPKAQKAYKVVMQDQLKKGYSPNDMGLLPDTLVMPTGANKPSMVFMPRIRLRLEWQRLKKRTTDFASLILYRRIVPRPRPKMRWFNKGKAAQALHSQMYSAFADGDIATLREICTDGIFHSFSARIAQRDPSKRLRWTLHKYVRSPRVVSHRAAGIPEVAGAGIRQAIVRIKSRQSLDMSSTVSSGGKPEIQDMQEYIVLQKRMLDNKEGPWMVWGTVEEHDWEKVV